MWQIKFILILYDSQKKQRSLEWHYTSFLLIQIKTKDIVFGPKRLRIRTSIAFH